MLHPPCGFALLAVREARDMDTAIFAESARIEKPLCLSAMTCRQKNPLRAITNEKRQELERISRATSEVSFMSLLHLSEGVLFLMGSIFFMPSSSSSSPSLPEIVCNSDLETQEKLLLVVTDYADE